MHLRFAFTSIFTSCPAPFLITLHCHLDFSLPAGARLLCPAPRLQLRLPHLPSARALEGQLPSPVPQPSAQAAPPAPVVATSRADERHVADFDGQRCGAAVSFVSRTCPPRTFHVFFEGHDEDLASRTLDRVRPINFCDSGRCRRGQCATSVIAPPALRAPMPHCTGSADARLAPATRDCSAARRARVRGPAAGTSGTVGHDSLVAVLPRRGSHLRPVRHSTGFRTPRVPPAPVQGCYAWFCRHL